MDQSPPLPLDRLLAEAPWVHRLARALVRDDALAADVAQDTLVAALEQRPRTGDGGQLRAWLRTVARRFAAAAVRGRAEREARERRVARASDDDPDTRAHARLQLHQQLAAAVAALPEPYRTAVTLRYLDELPPRAIARALAVSAEVARQRVHRGVLLLRQRLDEQHGGRAAWAGPMAAALPTAAAALPWIALMTKKSLAVAAVLVASLYGVAVGGDPPPSRAESTVVATAAADRPAAPAAAATGPASAANAPATPVRTDLGLHVTVVDGQGQPIAGARLSCWSAGAAPADLPDEATTDAAGDASFAGADGPGGMLVRAAATEPWLQRLPLLRGDVRVQLPCAARVAGQVFVDGGPRSPGIPLELGTQRTGAADLPAAVAAALAEPVALLADAAGRFAFAVHAPDWRGWLQLRWTASEYRTHMLVPRPGQQQNGEGQCLVLLAPDPAIELHVMSLLTVAGEVVWADDGSPVRTDLFVVADFGDGHAPPETCGTDDRGRFAIGVLALARMREWSDPARRLSLRSVTVTAEPPGCERGASVTLDNYGPYDRIRLEVPRAGAKVFLAVDANGTPIAGARAGSRGELGPETGADGRSTFRCPVDQVSVGAPGREVVQAPSAQAAGTVEDPLVFVLPEAARIEFQLRMADGTELPDSLRVRLEAPRPIQAGSPYHSSIYRALGSSFDYLAWHVHSNEDVRLGLRSVAARSQLTCLLPDRAFTLRVEDGMWNEIAEYEGRTPARGATALVEIALPPLVTLRGRVLGARGVPLRGAAVGLKPVADSTGMRQVTTTAEDGTFAFAGLSPTATLWLDIVHPDSATLTTQVRTNEPDRTFQLEAGRTLTIRVIDAAGTPVPVEGVQVGDRRTERVDVGRFRCGGLPLQPIEVTCQLGGRTFVVTAPAEATAVDLPVPTPAAVAFAPAPPRFRGGDNDAFEVRVTGIDPAMPAYGASLPDPDSPNEERPDLLLAPGRYRFQLLRWEHDAATDRDVAVDLPSAVELDLRAGERTVVALH